MNSNISITPALVSDIPALCGLLAILFSQEAEFTPDSDAQQRGLRLIIDNPESGLILVARSRLNLVGMVSLLFTVSTALGNRVGLLEDMVVMPDHRKQGIGSQLLMCAIETARQKGCKRITLLTDHDCFSAHHFYQSHGFTKSPMIPFRIFLD
ncbi:MAG: GNAT family N-acetyltransferase [Methylicorpusculum sp.]|uniref:GNAT family N-acetyltransferase n=1 Tax=Methylicorpusculum sp. TaxID=2713644 RepID=UPI002716083C|nr:GNAT family N-acetyltransferase [Methylicorpusculum sp.]MDO8940026.1 GNAT family N-acetyltransferase [Methylicorpusculum sp.]MDO9241979.1 GNAT family N-acetyltransferase [Methylicorpusculum sp.]MDP2203154.1 GNAT family N-acetyltransferase [Methylicorpusculum sp.]